RKEVFEEIDPAPKLGNILEEMENPGSATDLNTKIMADAREFFKRTFVTPNMLSLLEKIVEGFEGGGRRVFALYSFYGGGKTHTLLAIIHAFRNPDILTDSEVVKGIDTETRARLEQLAERIKRLKVELVPFAGDSSKFSGTPLSPTNAGNYAYRTVWGYIAHRLGKYYEFKEFDEKVVAPQQDIIGTLFEGEKALFVFDELSDYLKNLTSGEYREYAQTVVNFVEYFVQAVKRSKCVAVISLPVDISGRFDWKYEGDEIVQSLWNTLKGLAEPFEPLRSGDVDVVNVLRKRLFEDIPVSLKERTVQKFREKIVNYPEYFGSLDYADKVAEYYPFSPEYINLLRTLIVRTEMQRTRDALLISMKVLREIILSHEDPDLIMPWHVNLLWFERAFLGGLSDYRHVYIKQVENIPDTSYGDLAKYILRAIFLATYHYDSPIPRDDFPDIRAIVRMVYEPTTFSKNNWEITDVENALSVILATPEITHLNEKDCKYWFWRFPTIKEYIVKRAQRIYEDEDPRIYDKIEEFVKESLEGRLRTIAESGKEKKRGKGKRKKTERTHFFEDYFIVKDYGKYPEDNDKLKLVVILRPDLVSEVENIYNYSEESKPRSYKNTLVVLAPEGERVFKDLMMTASMLIASEEILEEIEAHYGEYGEEVVEVQKSIVDRERREQLVKIAGSIPRVYSFVYYYPVSDSNLRDTKVVQPGYDLAENVHMILLAEGKIVDTMVFDYLVTLIKNELGVDIERDSSMRTVGQILAWFKQNPRFPITTDKVVKKAIAEGVRMFRIGILRDDKVYFKPVHNTIPPTKDVEGVVPRELRDSDGILSRDRAIEEQFRILKENEKEVNYGTHVERIYYVVYPELGGMYYTLSQLETMPDWKEIFLSGVIVKRVEKIDYDLLVEVYPSRSVTVGEGESAKFTVRARPVNIDIDGVKIKVAKGDKVVLDEEMKKISTEKGVNYELEFEITPERDEEKFHILISAYGKQPIKKELTIVVKIKKKEKTVETDVISDVHIGMTLLRIKNVEDVDVLETIKDNLVPMKVNGSISGSILATYGGGELRLDVKNIDLETGIHATLEIADYGEERKITRPFLLDFKGVEVTELLVRKLEPLNRKVTFVLRSGGK
ncbi:DUF499 domain-containing protein, partial [Archaeoglobus sp.]